MTRMLCSLLAVLLSCSLFTGCSLFESGEDSEDTVQVDSQTVSGEDALEEDAALDAEDELLEESDDLIASNEPDEFSEDEGFEEGEGSAEEAFEEDDSLDDEFADAELDPEFSETNEFEVDQELAQDEFSDEGFGEDEFAFEEEAQEPIVDVPGEEGTAIVDVPQDSSFGNQVTNLEYKAFESGGTVVIETVTPVSYQVIENPDTNQLIIQLNDVGLPQRFKRPYITKDFKQDIATINAYQDAETNSAKFVIQLKRPMRPLVQKEGNSILVMTGGSSPVMMADNTPDEVDNTVEQPLDELVAQNAAKAPQQKMSINYSDNLGGSSVGTSGGPKTLKDMLIANTSGKKSQATDFTNSTGDLLNSGRFVGEKISLEFKDTDIRTIIEVIAEKSGVNLIMDNDVAGKTSLRLRNVPWDQALLVVLRSARLGYVKQGNVLRIAMQDVLSKEAAAVSQQIKNEKEAKLLSGGLKVKYVPISYAKVSELATKLKPFTSEKGQIAFDDRTSSLVITDYGEYIGRIMELIKSLDTAPMQVEIASKIVEAREDFAQEVGMNWTLSGNQGIGSQTANYTLRNATGRPSGGFLLDLNVGTFDLFGDLAASLGVFESQSKIKILSQPRIVTMNKTKARISQTTQVPVETILPNAGAQALPNITFQDLELSLDVTPQITFNGDVILEVEVKREFPGATAANGQRELNKRNAKTTVMVKNGKTAVIGGIYQFDDTDNNSGVPLLKDIPLIGNLFKESLDQKQKNELLVFLKPKILKETEDIEMISKASSSDAGYDPFKELSEDDESNAPVVDVPDQDTDEEDSLEELDSIDEEVLEL